MAELLRKFPLYGKKLPLYGKSFPYMEKNLIVMLNENISQSVTEIHHAQWIENLQCYWPCLCNVSSNITFRFQLVAREKI